MRGDRTLTGVLRGRPAAALLRDGRLEDLLVEPPDGVPRPGAIHLARLDRPMKGQGGAMVRLGGINGYLRQARGLSPSRPLVVQVSGFAEGGKAVPVTTRVLFKGRFAILTPEAPGRNLSRAIRDTEARAALERLAASVALPEGWGLILRSAAADADADEIASEIEALRADGIATLDMAGGEPRCLRPGHDVAARAAIDWSGAPRPSAGDFAAEGVLDQVDALAHPEPLPGGGSVAVQATRALVAVDVDTGADTSPAAGLKANLAALAALPRALRLRGLGGQIVVDIAPTAKKDRPQLERAVTTALRDDPVETAIAGWTPLGHLELTRKRDRWPVAPPGPGER